MKGADYTCTRQSGRLQGIKSIAKRIPDILENTENSLPGIMRKLLEGLSVNRKEMNRQVAELELELFQFHFISATVLASALAPSRTICAVFVARLSPPCITFKLELELHADSCRCWHVIKTAE